MLARQVDFAGSDAPLSVDELARESLRQFPTVIGAVVPVVNLPGIKAGQLTLSGAVLGDIFLGKILFWDDPAIVQLNPRLKLPDTPIAVVRRQDGSGTTLIWTHYLSQVSPAWKLKVGEGTSVHWPLGIGGKGNEGVATYVGYLPGAIGYVAWDFTKQNHMTYIAMLNAEGVSVQPGVPSFKAAAAAADWSSLRQTGTNQPGKEARPVMGATYVLLHTTPDDAAQRAATLKFFGCAFEHDVQAVLELDYVPLPEAVVAGIRSQWRDNTNDAGTHTLSGQ